MNQTNPIEKTSHHADFNCRIICNSILTGTEAPELRSQIDQCIINGYSTIYLDTKDVQTADLSGINEVINAAYLLAATYTEFILIYRKASAVEKWVETTGLNKFVKTAIVPAA